MIRMASCRLGRGCVVDFVCVVMMMFRCFLVLLEVLQNRIGGCTYCVLRPKGWILDRHREISRTLDFYACFFGKGRHVGGMMASLCCLFAESESVKYFMYEKKISIFWI